MKCKIPLLLSVMLLLGSIAGPAAPLGTAFTYQGRLDQNGQAANGSYQMLFRLYDTSSGGSYLFITPTNVVPVANGLFSVDINFGPLAFVGQERWLEISVRTNTVPPEGFVTLPRTRVAPAPNALYAATAGTVTNGAIRISQLGIAGPLPLSGQVLGYDGASLVWTNRSTPGGLTLPFSGTSASLTPVFQINNSANGAASEGIVGTTASSVSQVAGVRGIATSPSGVVVGVYGRATNSPSGTGIVGYGGATGGYFTSTQPGGHAGVFDGRVSVNGTLSIPGAGLFETRANQGELIVADWPDDDLPNSPHRFVVQATGNVGIGTRDPQAALDVVGNWDGQRPAMQLRGQKPTIRFLGDAASDFQNWILHLGSEGGGNLQFLRLENSTYQNVLTLGANDNVGIGTSPDPARKLDVRSAPAIAIYGQGGVEGVRGESTHAQAAGVVGYNLSTGPGVYGESVGGYAGYFQGRVRVSCLDIVGGCDLAEPFPMKEQQIEKGSVVVIDDEHPGHLKRSTCAYDKRVAGIVSGANGINPGIALKQEGVMDQGENVALTGRVYVKADASFGAIEAGDLLTTSDTPGHAMKASDSARAQGAILGKAMSALKDGTGLVLVLVTLQ